MKCQIVMNRNGKLPTPGTNNKQYLDDAGMVGIVASAILISLLRVAPVRLFKSVNPTSALQTFCLCAFLFPVRFYHILFACAMQHAMSVLTLGTPDSKYPAFITKL